MESVLWMWNLYFEGKQGTKIYRDESGLITRSARILRLQNITNEELLKDWFKRYGMKKRGLRWFGYLNRLNHERWYKWLYIWIAPARNKKGRAR